MDFGIRKIYDYLYEKNLSNITRVKATKHRISHRGEAPIIARNFEPLLRDVIKYRTKCKARYYSEKYYRDESKGVYADLVVLAKMKKEGQLQIELWQLLNKCDKAFYVHGYIDTETMKFIHFDIAMHYADMNEFSKIIHGKSKMDSIIKDKLLRLDDVNGIDNEYIFDIIKMFFPMDDLVEEFIE